MEVHTALVHSWQGFKKDNKKQFSAISEYLVALYFDSPLQTFY